MPDISVYDGIAVREAFATLFDFQYTEFVGVAESVTIDLTRQISVYETVTVVDAGIEFNKHIYTDPRPAYFPKTPVRELQGNFAPAINCSFLHTPQRSLSTRSGSECTADFPDRSATGSISVKGVFVGSGKYSCRTLTGSSGSRLAKRAFQRELVFTASGGDNSLTLNKTAPGRKIEASVGSGGFLRLSKYAPFRRLSASIDYNWFGSLDCVLPPRLISSHIVANEVFIITCGELLMPAREIEAEVCDNTMALGGGTVVTGNIRSPGVVVCMEMECAKPTVDYTLSYTGD